MGGALHITLFNGHPITNGNPARSVTFGPFSHVHFTSEGHILLGDEEKLHRIQGSVYYDTHLYRDVVLFCGEPEDQPDIFDVVKATPKRRQGEAARPTGANGEETK